MRSAPRYAPAVEEIAPGLWHWKALRESIGSDVSSCYLAAERVLIDPMIPPEGLVWFEEHGWPEHLLLTNRHHDLRRMEAARRLRRHGALRPQRSA
jgi:hypothetical protein